MHIPLATACFYAIEFNRVVYHAIADRVSQLLLRDALGSSFGARDRAKLFLCGWPGMHPVSLSCSHCQENKQEETGDSSFEKEMPARIVPTPRFL